TRPRSAGWFEAASKLLQDAVPGRADGTWINQVRNQAAANLIGFDAGRLTQFDQFGASAVVFDNAGNRLLMGPLKNGAKVWDGTTSPPLISSQSGLGPVAFLPDGTPVQLRYDDQGGSLILSDVITEQTVREVKLPNSKAAVPPRLVSLTPDGACIL